MRASRLISLVLLLQARREMTGAELAAELDVSERTVTRDVLALSEAGVPVYADRGRNGGYRLVGGYRTRLTGIARDEAEALFLSGVPSALREMGLADAAAAAELKVTAALVPALSDARRTAAQRFHLDAPGWWQQTETPPLLPALAGAVWDDRCASVRYRRRDGEVSRELEPYGLVLKAGVWYLAARPMRPSHPGAGTGADGRTGGPGGGMRVYRVDRFSAVDSTGHQRFARESDFDLSGFWDELAAEFARSILRDRAVLRLTAAGARELRYVTDRAAAEEALSGTQWDGSSGTVTVTLLVESLDVAHQQLLALGPDCEVLRPSALRRRFRETAERTAALYAEDGRPEDAGAP